MDSFNENYMTFCQSCIIGKQHKQNIPKGGATRATQLLELIHSDICGPTQVGTYSSCKYFITFIDDFSRYFFVYLMKQKSKADDKFIHYKNFVENQTNHKIKILRSDRGGEYLSHEFEALCSQAGIKQEYTTAYTPQQNGVSERKNRTLVGAILSMLSYAKLPKAFWGEALLIANYLQNRSPTKAISVNKTPFEIWFGKQPSLSYIKIFGCQAHVLVQRETRMKLDSHSIEATLLGYCEQLKAYRLLNNDKKNIIISRDVIFNENFHKHQNIVDNEEEEELIDSTFLFVPPTIILDQQPNINTNSFLPT